MNSSTRSTLRDQIEKGKEPEWAVMALTDLCWDRRAEIRVLRDCLAYLGRLGGQLQTSLPIPQEIVSDIAKGLGRDAAQCRWAIETWALALGKATPGDITMHEAMPMPTSNPGPPAIEIVTPEQALPQEPAVSPVETLISQRIPTPQTPLPLIETSEQSTLTSALPLSQTPPPAMPTPIPSTAASPNMRIRHHSKSPGNRSVAISVVLVLIFAGVLGARFYTKYHLVQSNPINHPLPEASTTPAHLPVRQSEKRTVASTTPAHLPVRQSEKRIVVSAAPTHQPVRRSEKRTVVSATPAHQPVRHGTNTNKKEKQERQVCPGCGYSNEPNATRCLRCGAPLKR